MKNYDDFVRELNAKIKSDDEFYYELLIAIVKNPKRYTGIFRVSNARTKLIQNVTQSREIKFGDFMEDIITEYIAGMGCENLDKRITPDLEADQLFMMAGKICLIEQKIRDDHETLAGAQRAHSTKKRGQYDNFSRKYTALREKYPGHEVIAVMWFIDDGLVKNRKYYTGRAESESLRGVDIRIVYGGELFTGIFARPDVWEELCSHLRRNKNERSNDILAIPDFDTSPEILRALRRLKAENVRLYSRLYRQSRNIYSSGQNYSRQAQISAWYKFPRKPQRLTGYVTRLCCPL